MLPTNQFEDNVFFFSLSTHTSALCASVVATITATRSDAAAGVTLAIREMVTGHFLFSETPSRTGASTTCNGREGSVLSERH